jgi:hypothetical protein
MTDAGVMFSDVMREGDYIAPLNTLNERLLCVVNGRLRFDRQGRLKNLR